jgi:protein-S-isoprenylcysteine O-methyltransferase Ste14
MANRWANCSRQRSKSSGIAHPDCGMRIASCTLQRPQVRGAETLNSAFWDGRTEQEDIMRIPGLVVAVLGWLIAMLSTQVTAAGPQLVIALLGFLLAATGLIRFMTQTHIENAVWKSNV